MLDAIEDIIGLTDLLLEEKLASDQREYLEIIRSSGDSLLSIINNILDLSKIEAGMIVLERQPLSLRECLTESVKQVAAAAREKWLTLVCSVDEHIPGTFLGDPVRIRQILVNLLSNAVKFTEEGGVTVSASSTRREDGSCEVHIFVKDTGIGIVAEKMDRLFHSFCQIDASTTRRYGGTGLGLAISRRLAEQMGGEISVESEAGKGSTFMVTIPAFACTRLDEEAAGRDAEGPAGDSKSGNCKSIYGQSVIRSSDGIRLTKGRDSPSRPLSILLAEDKVVNQKVTLQMLSRLGYQADVAGNGKKALDMI